jgi:predicted HTH domain antitoxin
MQLTINIPDNFLISVKEKQDDFIKTMLFNHAMVLYRKNKLSLGKAAELAGYDRLTFIQKLQLENEPIYDYEADLVNEMVNNSQQTLALLEKQQCTFKDHRGNNHANNC